MKGTINFFLKSKSNSYISIHRLYFPVIDTLVPLFSNAMVTIKKLIAKILTCVDTEIQILDGQKEGVHKDCLN